MKISLCASFMILYFNFVESKGKYNGKYKFDFHKRFQEYVYALSRFTWHYFSTALIFDRFEKALIEVSDELPKDENCGQWATACPAENNQDKNFNQKKSINGNALFIKNTYSGDNKLADLKVQVCDQPFKLSIAMFEQRPHLYFEFGYEVIFLL